MRFSCEKSKEEHRDSFCHWMWCYCLGLIQTEDMKKLEMVQKTVAMVLQTCSETRAGFHHGQRRHLTPTRADNHRQHQVCSVCARLAAVSWGRRQDMWHSRDCARKCVSPALLPQLQHFPPVFPFPGQNLSTTCCKMIKLSSVWGPRCLEPALEKHLGDFSLFILSKKMCPSKSQNHRMISFGKDL